MAKPLLLFLAAPLALSGCIVGTAVDVVTAPVRVASGAVDLATTSQSEADEKRGRQLREREERYGELERKLIREDRRCNEGNAGACERRAALISEMDELRPTLPAQAD
jgi:hypothetical protein